MQRDLNDVKKLTLELMKSDNNKDVQKEHSTIISKMHSDTQSSEKTLTNLSDSNYTAPTKNVEVLNISESSLDNYPHKTEENDNYTYAEDIEEEENSTKHKLNTNQLIEIVFEFHACHLLFYQAL